MGNHFSEPGSDQAHAIQPLMSQTAFQPSQDVKSHTTKPSPHRHTVRLEGLPVEECVRSSCLRTANPANVAQWQSSEQSCSLPYLASLRGLHIPESIKSTRETTGYSGSYAGVGATSSATRFRMLHCLISSQCQQDQTRFRKIKPDPLLLDALIG